MHLVFVIPHWMRDPFFSLYGPRIASRVTVVQAAQGWDVARVWSNFPHRPCPKLWISP